MFSNQRYIDEVLARRGFRALTEVQAASIPKIRDGRDLVVRSATGTGKTHSYLIPLFESLDPTLHELQVLVSAPTRELARQIHAFAKELADAAPTTFDVRLYAGGSDRADEIGRLRRSQPQMAIGTPGKLRDLVRGVRLLDVHRVRTFVVDEADMTLDEGFIESVDMVASMMPEKLQMLVFSATVPERIQPFLRKYLKNPEFVEIGNPGASPLPIRHWFIRTRERPRSELLPELLACFQPYLCVIFCNTKESAEAVHGFLGERGIDAALVHGGLEARKRDQVLRELHAQSRQYVVATDIISRGIDIEGITHIVNYELPADPEFYLHRAGRTGRMAKDGTVVSLYEFADDVYLDRLEAMGIRTEYKEIRNGSLVAAKTRGERKHRDFKPGSGETVARRSVKLPDKVKPGYKKKLRAEIEAVKKSNRGRRNG
jgi:ATP-dependent RNA helicase CshB